MQTTSTRQVIPVTLLTGFLGSGKTTVLNHLLAQLPRTAVVMNEFGEIGLDQHLLDGGRAPLALLAGGCVCCQVKGSLAPTLKNLWMARGQGDLPAFERLVIETTGIADPVPILASLASDRWLAARYRLDGVLATVDGLLGLTELALHPEARRQVALADRLVVTKTDQANADAVAALRGRLAELNPIAPILTVVDGAAPVAALLGGADTARTLPSWRPADDLRPSRLLGAATGAAHAGAIRSFVLDLAGPLDRPLVEAALARLAAVHGERMLRMKAIVQFADTARPSVLHGVRHLLSPAVELPAWPDQDRRSRFVFIVSGLDPASEAALVAELSRAARPVPPAGPALPIDSP
ncbi:GTP-binding protein [Parasulfuritortus cantonensis]|uniref:GTP-binding protein n=1 Tax=Parasulfuritortus cantonensis TaxID=2528202 RepID=A0A4R1BCF0_9PROT|nr:GTP-binding protein [Parasulfuritortus cantonensis]TCJ14719.1 GTP-binding protein [Parasulfuritortus cantonensis]